MNERHPSGTITSPTPASDAATAHYPSYGTQEAPLGDFTTCDPTFANGFDANMGTGTATGNFETDPLFGNMAGAEATGSYDNSQWSTGSHHTLNYDPYAAQHHAAYDTGAYDTTSWAPGYQQLADIPAQTPPPGAETSGQWDAGAWLQPEQSADQTQHWEWGTQAFDSGVYDATQWNSDSGPDSTPAQSAEYDHAREHEYDEQATAMFEQISDAADAPEHDRHALDHDESDLVADGELPAEAPLLDGQEEIDPGAVPGGGRAASRTAARNAGRSRRRTPAKRSALLTIAVPSACVMGVAGIAAASVVGTNGDAEQNTTTSAADGVAVKPSTANNKLDSQLESLSAGADDFADRASRTQERIDLKAQQLAEKKAAAAEAARKERLRPKYALPVAQHGLSAYFGQAGINWMSVHTGIDFPVSYGTTVMAATDGTVRTQWNSAYGNMMILTDKDGTETWYCHLSSYQVSSGTTVKAGEPIAYSGNSGNSTGPHLHFEVRPAGGSAIDPLPWLRSHGLDPT
ncbi:M23 family metallopeptidase [Streptomyces sp. ME02-8801-2C]|uniref:M23 family metallopeptidase n=1 Tax=Streptomyces sp. ME02-8801-2C TaxID=3028680 RepID=UPI0029AB045B|nr:M23 family metallopeptidase [Streptomyces sp. ME02-8801-2C]MDX3457830.1 M23 family metallopeptidase [Streptomyces sp. ME02-8801-2C]